MEASHIQQIVEEVFELYHLHGSEDYIGESISQFEHMCQAAQLAEAEGYDDDVILAAFFHDIGHLCVHKTSANNLGGYGIKEHEKLGADFLRSRGFSDKIASLVQSHVEAKRYLTFRYPDYFEKLSEASKQTLALQGGKMTEEEALTFESDPLFKVKVRMRHWDEAAKEINLPLPELSRYKSMAVKHLSLHANPQNSKF